MKHGQRVSDLVWFRIQGLFGIVSKSKGYGFYIKRNHTLGSGVDLKEVRLGFGDQGQRIRRYLLGPRPRAPHRLLPVDYQFKYQWAI